MLHKIQKNDIMFIKFYKHSQQSTIISGAMFLCIYPSSFNVAILQAPWSSSLHVLLRSLVVASYFDLPTLFTCSLAATLILDWLLFSHLCAGSSPVQPLMLSVSCLCFLIIYSLSEVISSNLMLIPKLTWALTSPQNIQLIF